MSTVSVFVGQCGNQLGHQYDQSKLENHEQVNVDCYTAVPRHDAVNSYRRSIMVDSESKVVGNLSEVSCKISQGRSRSKTLLTKKMRDTNIISGKRGRGNNWALGYTGMGTETILEEAMEALRMEAERCDIFSNIMMMSSLCGGTGGGLGSRLLEAVRDDYQMQHVVSCVVAPFSAGDTPLQHYNALLSLTSLQKFSDAVILFKNDTLSKLCSGNAGVGVTYKSMNRYVADCLTGITLPTDTLTPSRGFGCDMELSELIRSVCPQPSTKFLTVNHVSRQTDDMKALCHAAIGQTKTDNMGIKCHSLGSLAVLRGPATENDLGILSDVEKRMKKDLNTVSWNPFPLDFWTASKSLGAGKAASHDVTLVSNYSNIIPFADSVWTKARQMYEQKAYLHWYYKHGLSQDYFEEAFSTVDEICQNYTEAIS